MAIPYKCPVCEGRGTVPSGFYTPLQWKWKYMGQGTFHSNSTGGREVCRTCQGTGIVWSKEE